MENCESLFWFVMQVRNRLYKCKWALIFFSKGCFCWPVALVEVGKQSGWGQVLLVMLTDVWARTNKVIRGYMNSPLQSAHTDTQFLADSKENIPLPVNFFLTHFFSLKTSKTDKLVEMFIKLNWSQKDFLWRGLFTLDSKVTQSPHLALLLRKFSDRVQSQSKAGCGNKWVWASVQSKIYRLPYEVLIFWIN